VKKEVILIQGKCVEAFKGETRMSANLKQSPKNEMSDKEKIIIILCFIDKVL